MDDKQFFQDLNEPIYNHRQKTDNKLCKFNLSTMRTLICTFILIILALFKYFNYANYQQFGIWYNNKFKIKTFNASTVKNLALDKLQILQTTTKYKLESLINK